VIALGILAAIIFFESPGLPSWRNDAMRGECAYRQGLGIAILSVISIVALIRLHFWFGSSYRWIATWGCWDCYSYSPPVACFPSC